MRELTYCDEEGSLKQIGELTTLEGWSMAVATERG